jgi:quinol monooxygenase YgiN
MTASSTFSTFNWPHTLPSMTPDRRTVVATGMALIAFPTAANPKPEAPPMYGLIGKMTAQPGQRDDLIATLLEGTGGMPGCRSYVIATDPQDANAIWITEVWDSQADHAASLGLPSVKAAISKGRPMIADMGPHFETTPVGGHGL